MRRAFTLVELLTVMGIISILLAFLMPAILRAQQNADRVKCLASLRQIGTAVQLHRTEHHDYLPAAGWHFDPNKNAASGFADPTPQPSQQNNIATPQGLHDSAESRHMYYLDNGTKRPLPITAALGHYMYADVRTDSRESLIADLNSDHLTRLFLCPALSRKQMLSGLTQRDDKDNWTAPPEFSSYVFNEAVTGNRTLADTGGNLPPVGNMARIKHTSQVFFAADGNPRNQTTDNWLLVFDKSPHDTLYDFQQNVQQGGWGKATFDHERHQGMMNVLFLDGHAESVRMSPGGLQSVGVAKGIHE